MTTRELGHGCELDDDPGRLDLDVIHAFLSADSYWIGLELVRELVERGPLANVRWLLHTADAHGL